MLPKKHIGALAVNSFSGFHPKPGSVPAAKKHH